MRDVPFSTRALEMSILACCRAANSSALRPAAFIPRLTSTQKQSLLPPVTEGSVSIRTPRGVAAIRPQRMLAAAINSTVVAGENLTVGSTVWLPAESLAPGR